MATAEHTANNIRAAMVKFRGLVLAPNLIDPRTGVSVYTGKISKGEVLNLAGVRSRATLKAEQHVTLAQELDAFILEMKRAAGREIRGQHAPDPVQQAAITQLQTQTQREDILAQTIQGLQYRIMVLEAELNTVRAGSGHTEKVVLLHKKV